MKIVFLDNNEATTIGELTIPDRERKVTLEYQGAWFSAARKVEATDSDPEYFIYRMIPR